VGDAPGAIVLARDGAQRWRSIGAPYEAARCRMQLAAAATTLGDRDDAVREARVALTSFSELGARLDIDAAEGLLAHLA
jgi:hypothetical protein